MSKLYDDRHRALQEHFDSRGLADRLEEVLVKDDVVDEDRSFIESRDMFFLSTVDQQGRPTVSYKGGAAGFVRVVEPRAIVFPSYDGNGMFYSAGNIAGQGKVGLLFIDFEHPHRLRMQGNASVSTDDPLLRDYPGAQLLVRVAVEQIWVNCPRYVHRLARVEPSRYVPDDSGNTPVPAWKRIDLIQDVLPARDAGSPDKAGGVITVDEYVELHGKGEA